MPAQGAEMMSNSLTVIGAGVIGLSCAWRAAAAGVRVTVLDPAPASGASWVAGGMLHETGQLAATRPEGLWGS